MGQDNASPQAEMRYDSKDLARILFGPTDTLFAMEATAALEAAGSTIEGKPEQWLALAFLALDQAGCTAEQSEAAIAVALGEKHAR